MRPFRKERVASVVREIITDALARRLSDPRVSPLTTVTRVSLSPDLAVATIYLAFSGDPASETRTLAALRHAAGFMRRMVAEELTVRECPELRFEVDEAWKRGNDTMKLINANREVHPEWAEPAPDGETLDSDDADPMDVEDQK